MARCAITELKCDHKCIIDLIQLKECKAMHQAVIATPSHIVTNL